MASIDILQQVDIFEDLSDKQLEQITRVCEENSYDIGEVVFRENTASNELYIIVDGLIDIQVDPRTLGIESINIPGPTTIATLRRGQVFGEVALVDQGLRSASARTAAPNTRLLVVSRDDFINLCEQDFQIGYIVMRNIAADLSLKIRNTDFMVREQLLWQRRHG
jgi:CRP/FNR family cyclic AMP-dependent transcriptional regulator